MYIAMGIFDLERNLETLRRLSLKGKKIVIYCFDTWESQYDRWISMFDKINPRIIFFAYKQSACYFASKYNACCIVETVALPVIRNEFSIDSCR